MKIMELERLISEQSKTISKFGLVEKCRDVARKLGKDLSGKKDPDSTSAASSYVFSDRNLRIEYQSYVFGDEEIIVVYDKKPVFIVKERVNDQPKMARPLMVFDADKRFEVLQYSSGVWEQELKDTHYRLTTDVSENELEVARQSFGIKIPG